MKKIFVGLFTFLLVAWVGYVGFSFYLNKDGRSTVYDTDSSRSLYQGLGKVIVPMQEQVLVDPIEGGVPFYAKAQLRNQYPSADFRITDIPAHDEFLYAVGRFIKWEDIPSTTDRLLVVYEGHGLFSKYRVSIENSSLFANHQTQLFVEKVDLTPGFDGKNKIESINNSAFEKIGYNVLTKIIRVGDTLVLIPITHEDGFSPRDENGNYLISRVIVRRVGGAVSLKNEIIQHREIP